MKMGKGLEIVMATAFGVGLFCGLAGLYYGMSLFAYSYADLVDNWADSFAGWVGSENVQGLRDTAAEVRMDGLSFHNDFTLYMLLAVGIGAGGAIWMAWSIHKGREEIIYAPAQSPTPPSEIPPLK